MSYAVKEIYYTLQGEGYHTGRPAVLLRFAGCNLWTGREEDRATAICRFCDTEFVGVDGPGGGRFERPEDLAAAVRDQWPRAEDPGTTPFAVMTGGEPLLQLDAALMTALHREGFEIAVETNGTIEAPEGIDWLCVSPKAGTDLVQTSGDELKLVYPQEGAAPGRYEHLDFRFYFLQPMDGPHVERHTEFAIEYCVAHAKWRLSLQTHKLLGMP